MGLKLLFRHPAPTGPEILPSNFGWKAGTLGGQEADPGTRSRQPLSPLRVHHRSRGAWRASKKARFFDRMDGIRQILVMKAHGSL